jgi:hypothetical protein
MAADPKVDALLGRALRDKAFRDRLVANPADVAKEAGLSAEQLELVAGGLALGSSLRDPRQVMWCTEKTCNEKGGARVVIVSPDPAFNPLVEAAGLENIKKTPGTGGTG